MNITSLRPTDLRLSPPDLPTTEAAPRSESAACSFCRAGDPTIFELAPWSPRPLAGAGPQPEPPTSDRLADPTSRVGLNPQPLPPRAALFTDLAARVGLNPQPLPPRASFFDDPGSLVGFNPQPEPPIALYLTDPGSLVGFNPQPDPPGDPALELIFELF